MFWISCQDLSSEVAKIFEDKRRIIDNIKEAAGSSEDWTRLNANIPYTYVIELKPLANDVLHPNHNIGFDYPENKVKASSDEIYYGIKEYLVNFNEKVYDKEII